MLVFAARDTQHNSAVVLKQILEQQYPGLTAEAEL